MKQNIVAWMNKTKKISEDEEREKEGKEKKKSKVGTED